MAIISSDSLTRTPHVDSISTSDDLKPTTLLSLPVEIRLQIYSELFAAGKIVLDGGDHQKSTSIISSAAVPITPAQSRSSQLLRTCKAILYEARPVLYANTVFHVVQHTFAAALPSSFTDAHPTAKYICNVIWQVECDLLKRWDEDDLQFQQPTDWASLRSLEIRCRVDAWRGSYCGGVDERTQFVTGRDQVLKYGLRLRDGMGAGDARTFQRLVEDPRFLGKGEMRIRLTDSCGPLYAEEVVVEDLQS